ncbi:MAG: hypothetical protein NZM03_05950, partial [Limisphaera sp.]|nr:hypothetical protein [Limisphaera sp.]
PNEPAKTGRTSPPPPAEFAFFLTRTDQLRDPRRRFTLSPDDFALLNPNTRTCPVFRTRADADLTRAIYRRVPVLVNETTGQNPWGVRFSTMFHMANDSHLFHTAPGEGLLPLYEAKLIWQFDHRWATYEHGETRDCTDAEKQDPHFTVRPRYWVAEAEMKQRIPMQYKLHSWFVYRFSTGPTNERTLVSCIIPYAAANHILPIVLTPSALAQAFLLASFNAIPVDYLIRNKMGRQGLDIFYLKQLPVLPPSAYSEADLAFIVPRVLELVYTAWDLQPFAADLLAELGHDTWNRWFPHNQVASSEWRAASGSQPISPVPPPFKRDEARRAILRAELDAYYARLYGLTRKQLRYILDPADLTPRELENILDPTEEVSDPLDPAGYDARCKASDFPSETFRVLKEKELRAFGEYRTRRLVLEAWEKLNSMHAHQGART